MNKFIKIQKGGEIIEVHPDALANHQALGWVLVDDISVSAETPNEAIPAPLFEEKPSKEKRK